MRTTVLLVEDDARTANSIAACLEAEGMIVDHVADGHGGLYRATDARYDGVILDRMLPRMDGMSVLRAMRGAGIATPVLILSALASIDDRVAGLQAGADDYLVKPAATAELIVRFKRLIDLALPVYANGMRLSCADLEMDLLTRKVRRGLRVVSLQPRELKVLEYLLRRQDQVITRMELLEGIWNYHFDPKTTVMEVHISRLRRKIYGVGEPPLIHTVRNVGYRLSGSA